MAPAGVVPYGLHAVCMDTAGILFARDCVADSSFLHVAFLIVPFGRGCIPLNVYLYTVLACYVIRLIWRPILFLFRHRLVGSYPGPHSSLLEDACPVIISVRWQHIVEEVSLLLVLDDHHVCEVLLAPLTGLFPSTVWTGTVVVHPSLHSSSAAQVVEKYNQCSYQHPVMQALSNIY